MVWLSIEQMDMSLKRELIDLKYKLKEGYVGSCWTTIDIIEEIFRIKKHDERFVLSAGHAARALYLVLKKYGHITESQVCELPGHPNRDERLGIYCSSGSLGHGLSIALGMAFSDRSKNVYCLITDGECAEGSVWEALRIKKEYKVKNLIVYVNINGFRGYGPTDALHLEEMLLEYIIPDNIRFTNCPHTKGLEGHYHVLGDEEYERIIRWGNL